MATWPRQKTGARASADEINGSAKPEPDLVADDAKSPPSGAEAPHPSTGTPSRGSPEPSTDDSGETGGLEVDLSSWRATLPPPSELAGYESALEGASGRILKMVEESHAAQTKAAALATEAEIRSAKRGQYIALLLIILGFAASIVFFALGSSVAGIIYVIIPIVVLLRFPSSYRA